MYILYRFSTCTGVWEVPAVTGSGFWELSSSGAALHQSLTPMDIWPWHDISLLSPALCVQKQVWFLSDRRSPGPALLITDCVEEDERCNGTQQRLQHWWLFQRSTFLFSAAIKHCSDFLAILYPYLMKLGCISVGVSYSLMTSSRC